jgi:ATP-binding cassette subfamily B protein
MLNTRSHKNAPAHQQAQDDMITATLEYVRGIAIVKAYGQEGVAIQHIRNAYRNSRAVNLKIEQGYIPLSSLHWLSLNLASVAFAALAAFFALNGTITIPVFLVLAVFSFIIFGKLEKINTAVHLLKMLDNTMTKLDTISEVQFIDQAGKDKPLTKFDIQMRDVRFGYDSRTVLDSVSFRIPQNTTTAIVGPSGSGKTTICNLIARFYDVDSGAVTIGGTDIRELTCDSLLANISMVFQNVYLFNDTVQNNIRFGNPGATDAEVVEAAKQAMCHDFISALPEGYNTIVGEGGSTLSGGEKQRISIARAMLKNAPIVILDEATASVDPENEHLIQQAISALTHGKTIIVIAHRLATIEKADQILVMDNGQIAQNGTHKELVVQEGIYKRFIDIRSRAEGWSIGLSKSTS